MIRILYFARLRERLGVSEEQLDHPDGVRDVGALIRHLRQRGAPWAEVLGEGETLMMAVNQELARTDTPVQDGDEIGLFPPVTGG